MTVEQLVTKLKEFDPASEVLLLDGSQGDYSILGTAEKEHLWRSTVYQIKNVNEDKCADFVVLK